MQDYKNSNSIYMKYHDENLSNYSFLVTGGAGFIGSNLVEYLLRNKAGHVRVLDNLSNGYFENISEFMGNPNFEFILGDIRDIETCHKVVKDINFISHQAALGSVPRSIKDPITTNAVNVNGFLNMLFASYESKSLINFVYAASSSTYGNSNKIPKIEGEEGAPLSPYAVTKLVNEIYADVFFKVYNFKTIGLRYFNVFGPKQNPNNPYAAVIPLFCKAFKDGFSPTIYGDGTNSRDFTFVENVIQANIKSLFKYNFNKNEIFNVACGEQTTLNEVINFLCEISNKKIQASYKEHRIGDVSHSLASISKIQKELGYNPSVKFKEGLKKVYECY